jgi:catechol 2,3-dioxygenase-like lactoylglutathione lyase family enzyme
VDLYVVELTVADWPVALAWYRDRFGLPAILIDEAGRYALLTAGPGRVAIKQGTPVPGRTKLVFHVRDLDAELARLASHGIVPDGPLKRSPEGYRSARFQDPDGHPIEVFEWAT